MHLLLLPFACTAWVVATTGAAWWVTTHALTGGLR